MIQVVVVVGPTGVGKTKLGVALAKQLNGEVISGDSMQIYKHMDIGTAKVTEEEMEGVLHHLIDFKEINETYSVQEFQTTVRSKINEISNRGHLPIIVGGTGLYIKAALYDYQFETEPSKLDPHRYDDYSNEQLYAYLMKIDDKSAKTLHVHNRRRVQRAIDMYENGYKKSDILNSQQHRPLYDVRMIGLTLPRDVLYERINLRVDQMVENGLIEEFNKLIDMGAKKEYQSMKAIGYQEFFDNAPEDAIPLIKQHSRQYAKRQYTWFKNQFDLHWLNVNLEDFDQTVLQALLYIQKGAHYRYIAFNYHEFNSTHPGILQVKEGYSKGEKENPARNEIYHETGGIKHLNRIYYDESLISLEELIALYQPDSIYTKHTWFHSGIPIEKFYEL